MEEYTGFAKIYDEFMDNTPYDAWARRIEKLIAEYGISQPASESNDCAAKSSAADVDAERNLIVDLGCGTGRMTEKLSDAGYDVWGIDASEDMLAIAMEREEEARRGIRYLCQDMRDFELYGGAGTFISVCDCMNYLLTMDDLALCLRQVKLQLCPGGIFIFDFNTRYKYQTVIGDRTIAEDRGNAAFIWDNEFLESASEEELFSEDGNQADGKYRDINVYHVSFFLRDERDADLFHRFEETHYQRGYTLEEMKRAVQSAGLVWITELDSDTDGPVCDTTQRIVVVAGVKQ